MFWGVVICDLTFIAVAYMTNESNADMLLAGYNTMSKKEKESFDLKNYLIFFRKFFVNLTIYSSLIFLMFFVAFDEITAFIAYLASVLVLCPTLYTKGLINSKLKSSV